jgi:hypothetical protein
MIVKKRNGVNNICGFFISSLVQDDHGLPIPLGIGEKLPF